MATPMPRPMDSVLRHAVRFEFLKSARDFRVHGVGLLSRSTYAALASVSSVSVSYIMKYLGAAATAT